MGGPRGEKTKEYASVRGLSPIADSQTDLMVIERGTRPLRRGLGIYGAYGVIIKSGSEAGGDWVVHFLLDNGKTVDLRARKRDLHLKRHPYFIPADNKFVGSKCKCGEEIKPLEFDLPGVENWVLRIPKSYRKLVTEVLPLPFGVPSEESEDVNAAPAPERRRLSNQRLIDRFIRESIRCQSS